MAINVEEFYHKYGPMVLRRCRSILKNEEEALDAMQDVFVKVLKSRDRLNALAPSSLLYITATNISLNILKSSQRRSDITDNSILDSYAGNDDPVTKVLNELLLDQIFQNEKDTTRTIAFLHYIDRFTLEETADYVGMSVSGIRKRLRNLRKKGLEIDKEEKL